MTNEEWHNVLDVNLTGAFNTCKIVIPVMRKARYGRIINTSSINGTIGAFGQTNYAAAKAGILLLAQATLFSPASAKEISATVYEPDVSMM